MFVCDFRMLQFFEAHIIKLTAYLSLERGELKEGLRSAKNLGFRWFYGFTQCKARVKDLRGFKNSCMSRITVYIIFIIALRCSVLNWAKICIIRHSCRKRHQIEVVSFKTCHHHHHLIDVTFQSDMNSLCCTKQMRMTAKPYVDILWMVWSTTSSVPTPTRMFSCSQVDLGGSSCSNASNEHIFD